MARNIQEAIYSINKTTVIGCWRFKKKKHQILYKQHIITWSLLVGDIKSGNSDVLWRI